MQEEKWKKLVAQYEVDKKKDPDLAIPPDDSQLLPFTPKKLWQQGKEKWHVDAPVNLARREAPGADRLPRQGEGGRACALCGLNAATGDAPCGSANWPTIPGAERP